ncbi:hypothetical protein [Pedobacter sp. KLB.chiD]|uniref:hypothetical protein n=1 Tax=Pedobacter sp. KLB.chiD TaxID=3387402 RepID=UPI0039997851
MLYNQGLFKDRVPKKLRLLLMAVMTLPLLGISPIYTTTLGDMFSGIGVLSEDLSFANNASVIGMVLAISFVFKFKGCFTGKQILITAYLLLTSCIALISISQNIFWITILSTAIGFIKLIGMVELLLPLMVIISPTGDRGKFYAVFYPLSIILGQLSGFLAAHIAYQYNWQEIYSLIIILLLFCSLLALVVMHNKRAGKKQSFGKPDWISILLLTTSLLLANYVLVYAKQQGWLSSSTIVFSALGFLICGLLFILRQLTLAVPFIDIRIFKKRSVISALIVIFLMGLFLATSALQSTFTALLKYDAPTNAALNLAMIPGVLLGAVIASQWFKRNWSIKSMLFIAFSCFLANTLIMYFLIAPVIEISDLILPQALKGAGMCLVYIGGSFYFASKLSPGQMMSTIGIAVCVRSFIGSAFFTALLSWAAYQLQWDSLNTLSGGMDANDALINLRGAGIQLFSATQPQAILAAIKELFGYVALAGIMILFFVLLHPFERMSHRKLIIFRKRFKGELLDGYRIPDKKSGELLEIGAAVI